MSDQPKTTLHNGELQLYLKNVYEMGTWLNLPASDIKEYQIPFLINVIGPGIETSLRKYKHRQNTYVLAIEWAAKKLKLSSGRDYYEMRWESCLTENPVKTMYFVEKTRINIELYSLKSVLSVAAIKLNSRLRAIQRLYPTGCNVSRIVLPHHPEYYGCAFMMENTLQGDYK